MGVPYPSLLCLTRWANPVFLEQLKTLGYAATILTANAACHCEPPHTVRLMQNEWDVEDYVRTISSLGGEQRFDRIIALEEEFLVKLAAHLRERLSIPGMGVGHAANFYDKFAMRCTAASLGIRVPEFALLAGAQQVDDFIQRVSPPWILKPRFSQSSQAMRKIHSCRQWAQLLQDIDCKARSAYLVEQFIPGDVFHVDSVVAGRRVVFSEAHQYGRPPLETIQERGLFTTSTMDRQSADSKALLAFNARVVLELGLANGIGHAEFIKHRGSAEFYFLEAASRGAGSFIPEMIEAATGVNIYREWARVEVALARGSKYGISPSKRDYGGIALCFTTAEHPDMSSFSGPGIVKSVASLHQTGLILKAEKHDKLSKLLQAWADRLRSRFLASGRIGG